MITTGAISISNMMMVNHSLQQLYMSNNDITDYGISAIARVLGNCKINKLDVSGCGVTPTGARSLAAALSSSTIRGIWLMDNPITVEGAILIVTSAVHNTVCQYVGIDDEYKNDEAMKMMNILKDRRRQEVRHVHCIVRCNKYCHGNRRVVLVERIVLNVLVKTAILKRNH